MNQTNALFHIFEHAILKWWIIDKDFSVAIKLYFQNNLQLFWCNIEVNYKVIFVLIRNYNY